jgi:hypothetical protein
MPATATKKRVSKKTLDKEKGEEVEQSSDFPTFLPPTAEDSTNEPPKRKRGRKPKGGKIISTDSLPDNSDENNKPNVILHLRCHLKDLGSSILSTSLIAEAANNTEKVEAYSSYDTRAGDLEYQVINNPDVGKDTFVESELKVSDSTSKINAKLKELSRCLHSNDISDKKSACFWCTCEFDNPPISIPQYELNGTYHVYGCFCSPECAVAHLMEQRIDQSMKFERYALLNHLYCKLYDYERNIRPAPDPHYTLDKYYGNLSIQDYRKLLKSERLLLIVEKPLTRVLPELHQDSNDQMFGVNSSVNSNQPKYRLKRKNTQTNKKTVVDATFGITT